MNTSERDDYYNDLVRKSADGSLSIGKAIEGLRLDVSRMSLTTFSKITKVSAREVSRFERDEATPDPATLTRLLKPFGLEAQYVGARFLIARKDDYYDPN